MNGFADRIVATAAERIATPIPRRTVRGRRGGWASRRRGYRAGSKRLAGCWRRVAHDVNNVVVVGGACGFVGGELAGGVGGAGIGGGDPGRGGACGGVARRLLALARPGTSGPVAVDVAERLTGLERLIRGLAGPSIQVTLHAPAGLDPIAADPVQIDQVILNLVANARDALAAGGRLGVRVGAVEICAGRAGWPAHRAFGPYVCLTVADTGTGIDAATRARIFDPFFTTKGTHGTGVGLATVAELVESMCGHIEVDSEPGRGTVFRVYLPVVPTAEPIWDDRGTVLLADDDPGVRGVVKAALAGAGYDVIEAAAGTEAMRLARAVPTPIDVLVADVVMPGLGGRRLAAEVRSARPGIGVVYMSGYPADRGRGGAGECISGEAVSTCGARWMRCGE